MFTRHHNDGGIFLSRDTKVSIALATEIVQLWQIGKKSLLTIQNLRTHQWKFTKMMN